MATPTTTITSPMALNQTCTANVTSPWFVQGTEYSPDQCTFRPLVNGDEAFGWLYDTILAAKHSIDIICWGFQPSMYFRRGTGGTKSIGQLLVQKGKEDVKVRLLCWHDDWYLSQWGENNMPGENIQTWVKQLIPDWAFRKFSLLSRDYQTNTERLYDTFWYYCANLNNVTMAGSWFESALRRLRWLGQYPLTLSNVEFATRDFSLDERIENEWRLYMRGKDTERDTRTKITNSYVTGYLTPTHHQKMVLIDYEDPNRATGFVMGHNMLDQYWDTSEHHYARKEHDEGRNGPYPWQDVSSRITGPVLRDLNKNFCQAWDDATGQSLGESREKIDPCKLKLRPEVGDDARVIAQLLRTQSQKDKQDIKTMYLQAVNNATKYIFIQNQYFRWVPLADKIRQTALQQIKGGRDPGYHGPIHLFVITNSVEEAVGPGSFNTYRMLHGLGQTNAMPGVTREIQNPALSAARDARQKALDDALASDTAREKELESGQSVQIDPFNPGSTSGAMSAYRENQSAIQKDWQDIDAFKSEDIKNVDIPSMNVTGLKVHVCTLVAPDSPAGDWLPVYVHAKLMVIDDAFTTIGSANINSRSMEGDSELNICTEHQDAAKSLRSKLWKLHTNGQGAQDDPVQAFKAWGDIIKNNADLKNDNQSPAASLVGFLRTSAAISRSD